MTFGMPPKHAPGSLPQIHQRAAEPECHANGGIHNRKATDSGVNPPPEVLVRA